MPVPGHSHRRAVRVLAAPPAQELVRLERVPGRVRPAREQEPVRLERVPGRVRPAREQEPVRLERVPAQPEAAAAGGSVTPELNSGASRVVCWVRAPSSKCRAGPHAPDLQQFETEHIIERERRQRRLFAQHAGPQRALEPIGRKRVGRLIPICPPSSKH